MVCFVAARDGGCAYAVVRKQTHIPGGTLAAVSVGQAVSLCWYYRTSDGVVLYDWQDTQRQSPYVFRKREVSCIGIACLWYAQKKEPGYGKSLSAARFVRSTCAPRRAVY